MAGEGRGCLAWPQPRTTDNNTQCIDIQAGPLGPSPSLPPPPEEGSKEGPSCEDGWREAVFQD